MSTSGSTLASQMVTSLRPFAQFLRVKAKNTKIGDLAENLLDKLTKHRSNSNTIKDVNEILNEILSMKDEILKAPKVGSSELQVEDFETIQDAVNAFSSLFLTTPNGQGSSRLEINKNKRGRKRKSGTGSSDASLKISVPGASSSQSTSRVIATRFKETFPDNAEKVSIKFEPVDDAKSCLPRRFSLRPREIKVEPFLVKVEKSHDDIPSTGPMPTISELQELSDDEGKDIHSSGSMSKFKLASNIGFTVAEVEGKKVAFYKCFRAGCPFVLLDEESFVEHIESKHDKVTWNRFCVACVGIVEVGNQLTLLDEMRHLMIHHVKSDTTNEPSRKGRAAVIQKFSQDLVKPCFWKMRESKKDGQAAAMMVQENALAALFKCMEASCSFFTSDATIFASHLKLHKDKTRGSLECAYCQFESKNDFDIVKHIKDEHEYDIFSCGSCFYRSASACNVHTHYESFHGVSSIVVIECFPSAPGKKNQNLEFIKSKANLARYVPRMFCPFCDETFYISDAYQKHLRSHPASKTVKSTCQKCKKQENVNSMQSHFQECYQIGLFQCLYCRYGINSINAMKLHLAIAHPSKLPVYCSRSGWEKVDPKTIEALKVLHVSDSAQESIVIRKNVRSKEIINEDNAMLVTDKEIDDDQPSGSKKLRKK